MVPTRVSGQDMEKPKVVIYYNSGKEGANLSDAYLTSYCSTRSRLKKYHQKHFIIGFICVVRIHIYLKKQHLQDRISSETFRKFNFKMYNRSLLGRPPKTAPPTMINAPYYMTCIAATRNEYQESSW
jgi:hypothetical protein